MGVALRGSHRGVGLRSGYRDRLQLHRGFLRLHRPRAQAKAFRPAPTSSSVGGTSSAPPRFTIRCSPPPSAPGSAPRYGAGLWRGRILWPLGGFVVAVLMHAVNNGLIELVLVLRHGLANAAAWVNGLPVPPEVDSTADSADIALFVTDYVYVALFVGGVIWQRHQRREVAAALQQDVRQGLVSGEDVRTVCRFGGRIGTYSRLARAGRRGQLRSLLADHDEVGRLGMGRWRATRDPSMVGAIPELRRRVLAVQGVVREPGRVRTPELGIVGRERELAELGDLVLDGDAAPVHRNGAGRDGRLAIPDPVASGSAIVSRTVPYLVDLSPLGEAGGLGRRSPPRSTSRSRRADPGEWLGRLLRDRELLLVIDNFEHLAAAAAGVVSSLIGAVPRLRVLVTSRVVLGLPAETEYPLSPLPAGTSSDGAPSAAASLFIDRARRAGAIVADQADAEAVEEICGRLAACRSRSSWWWRGRAAFPLQQSAIGWGAFWTSPAPAAPAFRPAREPCVGRCAGARTSCPRERARPSTSSPDFPPAAGSELSKVMVGRGASGRSSAAHREQPPDRERRPRR